MAHATFSPENRIERGLEFFRCSGRSFAQISQILGVNVTQSGFAEGLKKGFDQATAERLLSILNEMSGLQDALNSAANNTRINIDWGRTETITTALTARRLVGLDDDQRLTQFADRMTKAVMK